MLVFLDIAANFDTVKHKTLHGLLKYIFVNSDFAQCIENVTTDGVCQVFVNGHTGPAFPLTRGTGQGDPLSSPQYDIVHHLLVSVLHKALLTRTNMIVNIQHNPELPPLTFADDTTPVLRVASQSDVDEWLYVWGVITEVTGLRVNPSKTQILLIGKDHHQADLELVRQIGVVHDQVTHLGVVHTDSNESSRDATYSALVPKLRRSVNLFVNAANQADLFHRSMLIRSLINSQMLHIFRVYPPTSEQVGELDTLVRSAL